MSETLPDYQRPARCITCDTARALTMRADSADWSSEALAVENRLLLAAVDSLTARAEQAEHELDSATLENRARWFEAERDELRRELTACKQNQAGHALDNAGYMTQTAELVAVRQQLADATRELEYERQMRQQTEDAMVKLASRVKEQQAELGEQEVAKLELVKEAARLNAAIRKASAAQMTAAEREAYASLEARGGTLGSFGAGVIMGRVSLAQDLLNLFDL